MPIKSEQINNPQAILLFLNNLEAKIMGLEMALEAASPGQQAKAAQLPADHKPFCAQGQACPACGPYLKAAVEKWEAARAEGAKAGRNDVLVKLAQAAKDLQIEEAADLLATRVAQVEAGEGDAANDILMITGTPVA